MASFKYTVLSYKKVKSSYNEPYIIWNFYSFIYLETSITEIEFLNYQESIWRLYGITTLDTFS